ncbi:ATP-binding protein [Parabacteroides sp. AF48-14]|uniref:ATP-binding protein n=1 Tax=Parabacteroides sp. AF48-14 TaxID=2292052 RepID=UPI000EFE1DA5|nr:ATP-binding protein [Parabacteroides sp. AF48-14]RHO73397.1 ATP-binding protein [Parabacteroides sp. AF48-14]
MITIEQKQEIADACINYATSNGWVTDKATGVNQLAAFTKVNVMYVSHIMRSDFTYKDSKTGENKDIADRWFRQLADCIGIRLTKEYWPHVDTPQFKEIDLELREALATSATRVLICESGAGKTYTVDRFKKEFPNRVFVVTCHKFDKVNDLIDKMSEATGRSLVGKTISRRLTELNVWLYTQGRFEGSKPMIIFDEAENLTLTTLQALKAMYDTIKWSCATVLIGTDQLIIALDKLKEKNKPGIRQFYRRFKAGIRYITPLDHNFNVFLADKPYPASFKNTIRTVCDNYGELYDFLVPAMREADEMDIPLTERFFRMKYKLPIKD